MEQAKPVRNPELKKAIQKNFSGNMVMTDWL